MCVVTVTLSVQLLASKSGSTIGQLDLKGESGLHIASRKGNADILEYLLRCGADPNLTASGDYPMHCAVDSDKPEYVPPWGGGKYNLNLYLKCTKVNI